MVSLYQVTSVNLDRKSSLYQTKNLKPVTRFYSCMDFVETLVLQRIGCSCKNKRKLSRSQTVDLILIAYIQHFTSTSVLQIIKF